MLFNSYAFIFAFLPLTLLGFEIAGRLGRRAVVLWLGMMSLAFYAYWKPVFLFVLLGSIALNYTAANLIARSAKDPRRSRLILWGAIALNLSALGYFKYLFPLLKFATQVLHGSHRWTDVLLPLGISFFTFTQIAYLIDLQQGIATLQDIPSYILFVTFFPHLIAGPILHHKDMMPQFNRAEGYRLRWNDVAMGLSWFVMGLAKKVLLADVFAVFAKAVFDDHGPHTAVAAWAGVLSYALQLYFDFSGYSDMALGLARMFSIDFPLNFSSPYKARNIIDFWERWHITLTRYINAYLFSPIQFAISNRRQSLGKKVSKKAQATLEGFSQMIAFPILVTMFIAGVWHGAGLQFIVFGVLHGLYISSTHGYRILVTKYNLPRAQTEAGKRAAHVGWVLLTLLGVLVADVFFRSSSVGRASALLLEMCGRRGFGAQEFIASAGIFLAIAFGFAIVWGMPNTQQILARFEPAIAPTPWDVENPAKRLLWKPTIGWALVLGVVMFAALVRIQNPSAFLYFQF
jgi:alginate O-acetyltransferase complex protein AlgI